MVSRTPLLNYYDILGLPRDASLREIEAAYRTRVVASRDQPGGAEETRRINLAYRALSDPDRRRDYDAALGGTAATSAAGAGAAGALFTRPAEAEAQVAEPWPTKAEYPPEQWDDEESHARPSNKRRLVLVALLAGLAMLAVLFASSWLGGDESQVASNDPAVPGQANAPGATAASPTAPEDDRGWLEETIDQVASLGRESPEPATAEAEGVPAAATPASPAASEQAGGAAVTPDRTEQASAEPPPEPAPTQTAEPAAPSAPEPVAAATPPPPPAPIADRSAPARLLSGGLYDSDNRRGRFTGSVGIRLQIGTNGRVQGCQVSRSSGDGELDATTCRLLSERLQFTPALNRNGEPVSTTVQSSHVWGRRRR